MSFDIGPAGDLAIFTNNDDMFNISTDVGPSFILNQGFDKGVTDVGFTQNVTSDIIVDMPNEAPIDFTSYDNKKEINSKPIRQKFDSVVSDATIEAEPIKKKKTQKEFMTKEPTVKEPTAKEPTNQNIGINYGFDDLLDNRKLKPVNDIIDEAASIGGESQSTIRHDNNEYPSSPNSPDYRQSFKPIPDSPIPTTFQKDRQKRNPEVQSSRPTYQEPTNEEIPKYINEDDEKMDLLLKLKSLEERGKIVPSKHYNMKSNIVDVRMEYRNQVSILEMQASTNFMRKGLIFCTSGMEYMNRRFDPVGAKLDGWGESVMENMMDYDGIFERLHNKYKGTMEMEPEMELLFALAGSAFQFHLSQTFFKSAIPQLGQVLRENPSVIDGFMKVAQEAARRNGPIGTPGTSGTGNVPGPRASNEVEVGAGTNGIQSTGIDFGALLGQVGITSGALSDFAKTMGNPPPPPQTTRDFKEPPMNDLYRQMMKQSNSQDDALSVSSETSDHSMGKRSNIKAVITPIPTSKRGGGGNVIKLM